MAYLLKVISQLSSLSLKPVLGSCTRPGSVSKVTSVSRQSSTLVNVCRHVLTPRTSNGLSQTLHPEPISHRLPMIQHCRTYKAKGTLKLRCSSCFFVRRQNRLFVECKAKPRHKQMQIMTKRKLFKDDYTIGYYGSVQRACFHKFKHDRYYELGNTKYSRHNWLEGKLGITL